MNEAAAPGGPRGSRAGVPGAPPRPGGWATGARGPGGTRVGRGRSPTGPQVPIGGVHPRGSATAPIAHTHHSGGAATAPARRKASGECGAHEPPVGNKDSALGTRTVRLSPAGAGCKGRASWPNAPSIPRVPAFTAARWPTRPHTSSPRMRSLLAPPAPPAPGPAPAPCPTRTPTAKRGAGERAQPPHPPSSTHRRLRGRPAAPARLCPAGRPGQRPRERTVLASSNYHADRHAAWKITEGPGKQRPGGPAAAYRA